MPGQAASRVSLRGLLSDSVVALLSASATLSCQQLGVDNDPDIGRLRYLSNVCKQIVRHPEVGPLNGCVGMKGHAVRLSRLSGAAPMNTNERGTEFVLPRIVNLLSITQLSPDFLMPCPWYLMIGWFVASKKSALRRCSSRMLS